MTLHEWIFSGLGVVALGAALRLVTSRNVVHAALFLVAALSAVAAIYLLLAAEFVAWVQVLIYVGAIVVLLLFGLMLTRAPIGREALDNQQRGVAAIVALGVAAGLGYLGWDAFAGGRPIELERSSTAAIGEQLFSTFVLPFEVVSFLLLAALIGAIVLARREEP
ncbi:MAG TPA: NADH-quinone oxidoreductase subunit J [Actinomycetota bacterium]|nr:NADH-quinone oxidoreductase subunit J [Actinomycetota bacterium]